MSNKFISHEQAAREFALEDQLRKIESLLSEDILVVIDEKSLLMKNQPEASKSVNQLFDDLGAVMIEIATVAKEKAFTQGEYENALDEALLLSYGLAAFTTKQLEVQRNYDDEKTYHDRDDHVYLWNGRCKGRFEAQILVRPRSFYRRLENGGEESRDARFKLNLKDEKTGASVSIRMDPGEKREIVFDIEGKYIPRLDLKSPKTRLQQVDHHFTHPQTYKLTRDDFAKTLEVLVEYIDTNLTSK